jgi:hypothetical protein
MFAQAPQGKSLINGQKVSERIKIFEGKREWIQWLSLATGGYFHKSVANRAIPLAI